MTDETKQTILDGIFRLGAPCLILAALLWMAREAAWSVHTTVVIPWVKSHTDYLEATKSMLDGIEKSQQQQAATMERIAEGQQEIKAVIVNRRSDIQQN